MKPEIHPRGVDPMSSERDPKLEAAIKRVDEIKGLGARHGIDPERVSAWIAGGKSVDDVSREILEWIASRSENQNTTPMAAEHHDEIERNFFERQFRRNSKEQIDVDREILRQVGCRSAKAVTTSSEAERKDEIGLSENEHGESKLDREITNETTDRSKEPVGTGTKTANPQPAQELEEVPTRSPRTSSKRRSQRGTEPRKLLIARIKSTGVFEAEKIVIVMDRQIEKMNDRDRKIYAPLDEWSILAPGMRSWQQFLDHPVTHERVRNYINKIPALPSGISKKSK
jgi:hypothetical protein